MSTAKWTEAQSTAIRYRGGSMLVSAAAGSGKTAVLVERIIQLITEGTKPIDADKLLVVTFTNAAAAELKGRITKSLDSLIKNTDHEQSMRLSMLRMQKVRLQRASICTMDAFCLSLIQKNFAALDIPPDFVPADSGLIMRLREQALAQTLEESYKNHDFRRFSDLFGRGRNDSKAGDLILKLYDFLYSMPHPWIVLEQFCRNWEMERSMEETSWCHELSDRALNLALVSKDMAERARQIASQSQEGMEHYVSTFDGDLMQINWLIDELKELSTGRVGEWDEVCSTLKDWKWERMGTIRGEKQSNEIRASKIRTIYKKIITDEIKKEIFICTTKDFEKDRYRTAPLVRALANAVIRYNEIFFDAKCAEKVLEFSDFEQLALRLLQDERGQPTQIAKKISSEYAFIMVDEYQDTNALQDTIYRCIANKDDSNRFLVGDLKQSIYRFRQADPSVFMKKMDHWPILDHKKTGSLGAVSLELDANFRSAPAVVAGINFFFGQIMSRDLGGVEYGPGQALTVGSPEQKYLYKEKETPYSGFCCFAAVEDEKKQGDSDVISMLIRQMVDQRQLVREGDNLRPCDWGDFCILLRSKKNFSKYMEELKKYGIPAYADIQDDLLESPHIQPIIGLLRILDNPAQDIPLAAVMMSPLFAFSPDDLVSLRSEHRRGSLYEALISSRQNKMKEFYEQLCKLRRSSQALSCTELLEKILADTGYLAAVGAMDNGKARQTTIRSFVHWAESAGQGGLGALIRNIDSAARSGGISNEEKGQKQPGCVSIMTVHRSKGLEFPIVFVADTSHKFNLQDLNEQALFHRELGIGINLRSSSGGGVFRTLASNAIRWRLRDESISEEMRILYVAMTRARDGLILTVPIQNLKSQLETVSFGSDLPGSKIYMLKSASNWGDWLLAAALVHSDSLALRTAADCIGMQCFKDGSHLDIKILKHQASDEIIQKKNGLPEGICNQDMLNTLLKRFNVRNKHEISSQIPCKVSVTAVVHDTQSVELNRPAFLYKEGLTGAEQGTATHSFLQAADFDLAAKNLKEEIQRQIDKQLILPEVAEKLDSEVLSCFFKSKLFTRIMKASSVLREYAFITSLPARYAMLEKNKDYGEAETLVQGVADLILIFDDHAEIVDYKTDRDKNAMQFENLYGEQLRLYRYALKDRLTVPITQCTIYSLQLRTEINISFKDTDFQK